MRKHISIPMYVLVGVVTAIAGYLAGLGVYFVIHLWLLA